jgi:hypothetical protein
MNSTQPQPVAESRATPLRLPTSPDELNHECVRQLEAAGVGLGNYIAVVGAGPSSPLVPASNELKREIAIACGLDPDDARPPWEFFEDARKNNRAEYCRVINARFQDKPFLRTEGYLQIVAVPFKSFITLNYDSHIQAAFAKICSGDWEDNFSIYPSHASPNGEAAGLATAASLGGPTKRLVAIHGFRDPNDPDWPATKIILTKSDYEHHYFSANTTAFLAHWWANVLTFHDCLFLGTSLQEPGIAQVLKKLRGEPNVQFCQRKHLHLKDVSLMRTRHSDSRYSDAYPEPRTTFGCIRQVLFDPKKDFCGLHEVLSQFSRITSPTTFVPREAGFGGMPLSNSQFTA